MGFTFFLWKILSYGSMYCFCFFTITQLSSCESFFLSQAKLSFSHLPGENTWVPLPFSSGFISPRCSLTHVTFLLIVLLQGMKMIWFPIPSLKMWKQTPRDIDLFFKPRLQLPLVKYLGLQPAFCHSPELPPSLTLESSRFSPFLPLGLVSHHALLCYQIAWLTFL